MSSSPICIEELRARWTQLYGKRLPFLAVSKSPVQSSWPVHVDHCFGRIILDTVVGFDTPWTTKLKGPALKNMNAVQLQACIALGERIAEGKENLVELDEKSLRLRGKSKRGGGEKRKRGVENLEANKLDTKRRVKENRIQQDNGDKLQKSHKSKQLDIRSSMGLPTPPPNVDLPSPPSSPALVDPEISSLIKTSNLTTFRQRTLLALCQVPPGRCTTYAALSRFLNSCPRAVGGAMRNNPFAPRVPCHRVVASDRGIGGFGGDWGSEGKHAQEKVRLLREEGVDVVEEMRQGISVLRVKGRVWDGFR